jgi:hypothetical protein
VRRSWLSRPDPAVAAADRRAAALGPAAHAQLLAAGDRLAEVSALLALRAYEHAAAAWSRFGEADFRRWWELGAELAGGEPACREGALAYFGVAPADFGPGGLDTAAAWCALGRDVARVSRRLAVAFFERTAAVLRRPEALPRLRAWVDAGLPLHETRGWRGAFLAQAFFDAAPDALAVLGPADYRPWAEAGAALADAAGERQFFAAVPPGLAGWSDDERARFLAATVALAGAAPRAARVLWRELPPAVRDLSPVVRAALLRTLAGLPAGVAGPLAEVVPVVGAVVREVPEAERLDALAQVSALAAAHPDAAVGALRVLPRCYEEAAPADVRRWFAAGAAIAAENAAAGRAYFALESRTSLRVLHAGSTAATLEETEGVWRKLVQMLSGEGATVRGVDGFSLRPPLEDVPAEREVALPLEVDLLRTHEENCRLYRFLAAQLAGRREFGTYVREDLRARLRDPAEPELLEDLLLLAEGVRIHHHLAGAYVGLAGEAAWAGTRLLERWGAEPAPTRTVVLDALLALVLGARERPRWLPAHVVALVAALTAPLAAPTATVEDAVRVAHALAAALGTPALLVREVVADADLLLIDDLTGGEALEAFGAGASEPRSPGEAPRPAFDPPSLELGAPADERAPGGRPLGAEELRRLLEAGMKIGQGRGEAGGEGLPITALLGKIAAADLDALRRLLDEGAHDPARRPPGAAAGDDHAFAYDEWDHRIADYRAAWCRLREVTLAGDSGEFFGRTLADYARLLPEVRRQFQRIRPEMYRTIRGLEDGEDFDLNAVTDARIEVRARRAPSTRLYRSRMREARDVATLFLLDMSASTDEPLGPSSASGRPGRRIIDALKEALVIMTEALDELGDAYAIYGFSGQGRANVEFYLVKGFGERLGAGVKARIGGIAPRRSTRMGTAVRHAARKMAAIGARSKHLMLLSDGFPQDEDYGEDRRSHVYGIRDTAVALREADAAGITPFCITVDRAGHDYLREMCDASRYMVIDDIDGLPRELPKIYRRVVRA